MKLHLPKLLRNAVLACLAAVAPLAVTVATGTLMFAPTAAAANAMSPAEFSDELKANMVWYYTGGTSYGDATVTNALIANGDGTGSYTSSEGRMTLTDIMSSEATGWTFSFDLITMAADDWRDVISLHTNGSTDAGSNVIHLQKNKNNGLSVYQNGLGGGTSSSTGFELGSLSTLQGKTILFTFDGTTLTAYVNGTSIETMEFSDVSAAALTGVLMGGPSGRMGTSATVEDICIWDVALTAEQILALFPESTELIYAGGTLTWNDETSNTVFSLDGAATAFAMGDSVTFTGNSTVTLGEAIDAVAVTVNEGVSVSMSGEALSVENLNINGTLTTANAVTVDNSGAVTTGSNSSWILADGGSVGLTEAQLLSVNSMTLEEGSTLTMTTTTQGTSSALANVSGAGDVVLNLGEGNGTGLDLSAISGDVTVASGRLRMDQTTLNADSSVSLTGGNLVFAGTTEITNDIAFNGSGNNIWVNSGITGTLSGTVSGTGTMCTHDGAGTLVLSGTLDNLNAIWARNGGTTNLTADGTLGTLLVSAATVNFDEGADLSIGALRMCEYSRTGVVNINEKSTVTVTGTSNADGGAASMILAHWGGTATMNLNGGTLNVENCYTQLSKDGTGIFNALSGTANLYGIDATPVNGSGKFVLGASDGTGSAVVNIGAGGIAGGSSPTVELYSGTLAATDDWSLSGSGQVKLHGNVTFDTAGHTITIAPYVNTSETVTTGEGDAAVDEEVVKGSITKNGQGLLAFTGTVNQLVAVTVNEGFVSFASGTTIGTLTAATDAGLAFDLAAASSQTAALVTAETFDSAITLSLSTLKEGTFDLLQGAAGLTADDVSVDYGSGRGTVTTSVTDGLVSVTVSLGAMNLYWNVDGANDTWGQDGSINWSSQEGGQGNAVPYYDGDSVIFAGTGETVTIASTVQPAEVQVTGTGYIFNGSGSISNSEINVTGGLTLNTGVLGGGNTLVIGNGGELNINAEQASLTGSVTVEAGGLLSLNVYGSSWGYNGILHGDIDVYGTLRFNSGDVTGWSGVAGSIISRINVYEGGELFVNATGNQTFANVVLNLEGGSVTGISGSNIDLFYGNTDGGGNSSIIASAADGATADNPTVSTISGVQISLRQRTNVIMVEENARLDMYSTFADRTGAASVSDPDSSIPVTVTKAGAGELVILGNASYTKDTLVNEGTLTVADGGSLASANVTVAAGTTLNFRADTADVTYGGSSISGDGSIIKTGSGMLTVTGTATIADMDIQEGFVAASSSAALTLTGMTVAEGTGLGFNLADCSMITASDFTGSITLALTGIVAGEYDLMQGASDLAYDDVVLQYAESGRLNVTKTVENGLVSIAVELVGGDYDLTWETDDTDNVWLAAGGTNWKTDSETDLIFLNGDSVTFSGTGETVTISGEVQPTTVTIDGTGWVFDGSGSITGTSTSMVVKSGSDIRIENVNRYQGGTTVESGATVTMANTWALGTGNLQSTEIMGVVSGAGHVVIDFDSASTIGSVAAANPWGNFTGTVEVKSGILNVGARSGYASGNNTAFTASKVTVHDGSQLRVHLGGTNTFSPNIDLAAGSTLFNKDGHAIFSGNICFNCDLDNGGYDSAGTVKLDQFWSKTLTFSGLLAGEGTVKMCNAYQESWAQYKLTNNANTFSGTYELVDDDNTGTGKTIDLLLAAETAAQYATVNLNSTSAVSSVTLSTSATVKAINTTEADNLVTASAAATLSVSEGDFAGILKDGNGVLSLNKTGEGTLTLSGANTYTGTTTVSGGTLKLTDGVSLPSAVTVQSGATLEVNSTADVTVAGSIAGEEGGVLLKSGAGTATLSGGVSGFGGTISLTEGTLSTGTTLELAGTRTLSIGTTAVNLASALTLNGGTLSIDYTGSTGDATPALTTTDGTVAFGSSLTALDLAGLEIDTTQDTTINLLAGVTTLLAADGSALTLDDSNNALSNYFTGIDSEGATLSLTDGVLSINLVGLDPGLIWDPAKSDWNDNTAFDAEEQVFTNDSSVRFLSLEGTGATETVIITGNVQVDTMTVNAGEGNTYEFVTGGGAITAANAVVVNEGTLKLAADVLTASGTIVTVNNGGILQIEAGASSNSISWDMTMNDGSTLKWGAGNTQAYTGDLYLGTDATVTLDANGNALNLSSGCVGKSDTCTFILTDSSKTANDTPTVISLSQSNVLGVQNDAAQSCAIVVDDNVKLALNAGNGNSAGGYANNISGAGDVLVNDGWITLTGNNTYTGETLIGYGRLYVDQNSLAGSKIRFTDAADGAQFYFDNTSDETYTFDKVISSDLSSGTEVCFRTGNIVLSSVNTYAGTTYVGLAGASAAAVVLDLTGSVAGNIDVRQTSTLVLHGAVTNAISGAGTVQISGQNIEWNSTSKTYTGTTVLQESASVYTKGVMSSGGGAITLKDNAVLVVDGGADVWKQKISGTGALLLSNLGQMTTVGNMVGDSLSALTVTNSTELVVNDSAGAAATANVTSLTVNTASAVTVKTAGTVTLGSTLNLTGAGTSTSGAALGLNADTAVDSSVMLSGNTTISATGTAALTDFSSNGHALTKTGDGTLTVTPTELSGALNVQAGTLAVAGSTGSSLTPGAVTIADGATLSLGGATYTLDTLSTCTTSTLTTTDGATAALTGTVQNGGVLTLNGTGTVAVSGSLGGTVNAVTVVLQAAGADSLAGATLSLASATLTLTDKAESYNISRISATAGTIDTAGATRHMLNITTGGDTFAGVIAGTVDLVLKAGTQNLTGTLTDGSTYKVTGGTLSIAATDQTGSRSFTVEDGVLDMSGYTRTGDGTDTIYAPGGTVNNLSLTANMVLTDTVDSTAGNAGKVTLGGTTELGAGTLRICVTEASDLTPGGVPYVNTDTVYEVGTDGTLTLAGNTYLEISLINDTDIINPTGDDGMDHTLIKGISLTDAQKTAAIGDLFTMNLGASMGSTSYELKLVAGDNGLYNLILHAEGSASTLFWNDADGTGVWDNAADNKSWLTADVSTGTARPSTNASAFTDYDFVIFDTQKVDDTTVDSVVVTVDAKGVNVGSIIVQGETDYTINGNIGSIAGNTGATLTKDGDCTLTLNGENTYAGDTILVNGTIVAQNAAALSDTTVQMQGGTLVLELADDSTLGAAVKVTGSSTLVSAGKATVNLELAAGDGSLTLGAAEGATLTVNTTYTSGAIIAGSGTATGTVSMTLDEAETLTSVTVNAGTLDVKLAENSEIESLDVASGAVFSVSADAAGKTLTLDELTTVDGASVAIGTGVTLTTGSAEVADNSLISLADGASMVYTGSEALTLSGNIASAGGEMSQKDGTTTTIDGKLTLTGGTTMPNGGSWTLAAADTVVWEDTTAVLEVATATELYVQDGTDMENVTLAGEGSKLLSAGDKQAEVTVAKLVAEAGSSTDVYLTIDGAGSEFNSATTAGVVVNSAAVTEDAPALTLNGATINGHLTIKSGYVKVADTAVTDVAYSVTLMGDSAYLDLAGGNTLQQPDVATKDILVHAGHLLNAGAYDGTITISDQGTAQNITLGGLTTAAQVELSGVTTGNGVTTLSGMQGIRLADGSLLKLSSLLEQGKGNVVFDFGAAATTYALRSSLNVVEPADGATFTIDVNDVLGDVIDAGTKVYTLASETGDLTNLQDNVVFDSALGLYNITATFGTDGTLTLTQVSPADSTYRSSCDNVDGSAWGGTGDVYTSADAYASILIDKDTVIDLTDATRSDVVAENGMVLSNLIGKSGSELSIVGDGDDLVTINNNLAPSELTPSRLTFNGDITLTDTELQFKSTDANTGELDPDSTYRVNGALTTDEHVTLRSGIVQLAGNGSSLTDGVTVYIQDAQLVVLGDTELGGEVNTELPELDTFASSGDIVVNGATLTLRDGAEVGEAVYIKGDGAADSVLSTAEGATVEISGSSTVNDLVLNLAEDSVLNVTPVTNSGDGTTYDTEAKWSLTGLTGSGAIATGDKVTGNLTVTPVGDSVFSGDLSDYTGTITVNDADGTQTLAGVMTSADSAVDLVNLGSSLVINTVDGSGNKTLNLNSLTLADGSATTFEMNAGADAPAVAAGSIDIADGAAMTLSFNDGATVLNEDAVVTLFSADDISVGENATVTLDITDDAFRKLSETATLSVVDGNVVLSFAAAETNRYADAVTEENALAGAELLWPVDPSGLSDSSDLKAVDQAVADLLKAGETTKAGEVMAAAAGASTAVMGAAFSADVERQLRAIRNRTTTMGVSQCEVNEGMPYVNAWINAEGDHRELDSDGLAAGYTLDSWGGTVGFDVDLTSSLTMGLAVTAMYGDLEADGPDTAEGDFDTQYVSAFARVAHRAWVHTFVATVGRVDATLDRTVNYGSGSYKTTGEPDGMGFGLMYEVARTFSLSEDGSTCWQPVFNVAWRRVSIDGYTEDGSDAGLDVGEQEMNVVTFGLGARMQTIVGENIYNRASIFEARAMLKLDAGDRESEADVAVLGGGSASVTSAEMGAVGVEIGAGVTIPVGLNSGAIFIDGSAEFRSGYTNVNGTVGYRINF